MTSTTHFKPMANKTNSNVAKSSFVKHAATGVAFALAPFAIVAGIAAFNAPAAEAGYTQCHRIGNSVICNSF